MMKNKLVYLVTLFLVTSLHATNLPIDKLHLPQGLNVTVYALVPNARQMALGDNGVVYVGSTGDKVSALIPSQDLTHAIEVNVIAKELNFPNGVAFHQGSLYIAEIQRIVRLTPKSNQGDAHLQLVTDDLPDKTWHGLRVIHFGSDNYLYVGVGVPCNSCLSDNKQFGTILRRQLEDDHWQVYADGIRNTVGFDWEPKTGKLWFSDNGQDWMGDELPPDEINHAPQLGMNFGFPYVYGDNIPTPQQYPIPKNLVMTKPAWLLPAHVAPLGIHFYRGKQLAKQFQGKLLVCEHGSWNRSKKIGYRVTSLTIQNGKATNYQVEIDGWIDERGKVWGRPVDILEMPDGALLISDDHAGAIYRIASS
jgi:glucose/arabinose dehydrogenase